MLIRALLVLKIILAKGVCFERQSSSDQYAMSLLQTGQ